MIIAGALVGAVLVAMAGLTVFDAVARPGLRRLAIRNIARRPTEALLVVLGTMLGTAIITAALIVGDTFESSIVDDGRRTLGPIDVRVRVDGFDRGDELEERLAGVDIAGTDGRVTLRVSGASVATVEGTDERRGKPFSSIAEVDFDDVRTFGGDAASTGFASAGPTPAPGQVVIGAPLADRLRVAAGDEIDVFLHGEEVPFEISRVLSEVGVAGYADAFVAPGTIASIVADDLASDASPPSVQVLFSGEGGVFDGAAHSDAIVDAVRSRLVGFADVDVDPLKADLLDDARQTGQGMGQLFSMIGSFSVIVGVLLLVNLFVMLAEERKQELGVLRALGFKRNHLLRAFGLEGALYAVVASVLGGMVGIGVGWAISLASGYLGAGPSRGGAVVFRADSGSVLTGMAAGLVISLVTVWLTSARIAGLNVIRAIRDLPEPTRDRPSIGATVLASLGVAAGTVVAVAGFAGRIGVAAMVGIPIAVLSAIPLLRRVLPPLPSMVLPSAASLAWGLVAFSVAGALDDSGVEVFVAQGIVLVGSGVLLLSTAEPVWKRLTGRLASRGRGLAAHLALAYPLARRVRTGILLAMFSLTIFVMTFMSMFGQVFSGRADSFAASARGGFDLAVDSNAANPVDARQLRAMDDVVSIAPIVRAFPEFSVDGGERRSSAAAGFDRSLVDGGVPLLTDRAPGLASDRAVYDAVLASGSRPGPALAIVPEGFLSQRNGPPERRGAIGQVITMHSPFGDETMEFEVVGLTDSDFLYNGLLTDRDVLTRFVGPGIYSGRFYVGLADGVDAEDFAARLDGALIGNGVRAQTFLGAVQDQISSQESFMQLLQGYLGLGLVIGVAGLGVVMVRAVRERRRQVGILRAMGFTTATVRLAYLLEAAFIAGQGIVLGIGLGMLTAYQVLVNSEAIGGSGFAFSVPWPAIGIILTVPLVASLLATVVPASQAAAIRPAEALRLAD